MATKLSQDTIKKLKQIKKHLDDAESLFEEIGDADNQEIFNSHGEGHSLNHCIRWGAQACSELVE